MYSKKIHKHIVNDLISINEGIKKLNNINPPILFVTDKSKNFLGTVTDGDVRRYLLSGKNLKNKIHVIMNKKPHICNHNSLKLKIDFLEKKIAEMSLKGIPVLKNKKICGAILSVPKKKKHTPVLIMAGGKGTRLLPFTKKIPKPLVRLNDKPILHFVLQKIIQEDFENLFISINHFGYKIKEFFNKNNYFGLNINFIEEKVPLGTAGSLHFIKKMKFENVIVINADVITDLKYEKILNYHKENNFEITMSCMKHKYQLPFGSVITKNNKFKNIIEKPIFETLVNAGIYVINKKAINKIKTKKYLSMVNFINKYISANKIGIFPMYEEWIDIGNKENLLRARDNLKKKK